MRVCQCHAGVDAGRPRLSTLQSAEGGQGGGLGTGVRDVHVSLSWDESRTPRCSLVSYGSLLAPSRASLPVAAGAGDPRGAWAAGVDVKPYSRALNTHTLSLSPPHPTDPGPG